MARGRHSLLAATLLLLAATAQSFPRRAPPSHRRVGKQQYMLPAALEELVRRNHNCSVERRELQTRMRTLKATCKVSSGIPEDELSKIKQEGPTSEKGKCFLGCMMEGMNIIEGGAFARERAERLVSAVYAEGAKRRSARDAVRACAQEVTTTDRCETGGLVFECFRRHRVGLFGSGARNAEAQSRGGGDGSCAADATRQGTRHAADAQQRSATDQNTTSWLLKTGLDWNYSLPEEKMVVIVEKKWITHHYEK